jgi:hypothetical protein
MEYIRKEEVKRGLFDAMEEASKAFGERNDCSVKAVAVAAGVTYRVAREALRKAGRNYCRGAMQWEIHNALKSLGVEVVLDNQVIHYTIQTLHERNYVVKNLTTRQLTMFPSIVPVGTFLAYTNGHVVCIKDGQVHCWGATKALRIKSMYRIV